MNSPGSIPPHIAQQGRSPQTQPDPGAGLNTGARGMSQGQTRDSNPHQQEQFGRSLQKALALHLPPTPDVAEDLPAGAVVAAPPLPFLTPAPLPAPAAETPRATVENVAARIDRYLRGSEAGQSLRQDGGMVVRLPANVLGVTEVSVRLRGDVLLVSIAMQAETAATNGLQSQIALLGQALSLRHPRQSVRVVLDEKEDADSRADDPRGFNPLIPKGRIE